MEIPDQWTPPPQRVPGCSKGLVRTSGWRTKLRVSVFSLRLFIHPLRSKLFKILLVGATATSLAPIPPPPDPKPELRSKQQLLFKIQQLT